MEPERRRDVQDPVRTVNWTTILLIGGLVLLVLLVAYFATTRNSDQDKLTNAEVAVSSPASHEKLCSSKATYNLMKRELFRRAAQLRGNDQGAYDSLSNYSVLRMENPVMESEESSTGAVNCSGSLSIDLPPGIVAVGGRRSLVADVDYTVQPAADGTGNVVVLRNADAIIAPLATLARAAAPPPQVETPTENEATPTEPQANEAVPEQQSTAQQSTPPSLAARPSFACANARTRGETAVCNDPGLAGLDRNMTDEYGRAFAVASPEQRALLRQTARRFYGYRDRCPDPQCIANAYRGRIREIRDIVEGRWQPPQ